MNALCPSKKWTTKLSSAGLVYYHFGERLIKQLMDCPEPDDRVVQTLYNKVYGCFMEEIDAIDNGINIADGELRYTSESHIS